MKKIALALAFVVTAAMNANAADMPVKALPPPASVYNWTGFYVGGNLGYSWGDVNVGETLFSTFLGGITDTRSGKLHPNGWVGGGQFGYNWQAPASKVIFGIEADIQATGEKDHNRFICDGRDVETRGECGLGDGNQTAFIQPNSLANTDVTEKLDWFGTVRGRLGMAVTPTAMIYGTGGLAYGLINTGVTVSTPTVTSSYGNRQTRMGWTAGAGIEGAIGGGWTAKLEYLYLELDGASAGPAPTALVLGAPALITSTTTSGLFRDSIIRAGLNYRFGGPVVAKY